MTKRSPISASFVVAVTLLVAVACTHTALHAGPTADGATRTGAHTARAAPIELDTVAALATDPASQDSTHEVESDQPYLDGMALAVHDVNAAGGVGGRPLALRMHQDGGDPAVAVQVLRALLTGASKPVATLYIGPGTVLASLRYQAEQAGSPIVLLEGDVYTSGRAFEQVFQTTIPWVWQAKVIARYVVNDRQANDVVFGGEGPEAASAARVFAGAMAYWGGRVAHSFTFGADQPIAPQLQWAAKADWFVAFGQNSYETSGLVNALEEEAGIDRAIDPAERPGISGPADLLGDVAGLARPEPGTSACYTYTWAGWAEPIARVERFRAASRAAFGRDPGALEQEGYDAVRTLALGLRRDGGVGGARLTNALEHVSNAEFSSFAISFGPDDHEFLPRDNLGLFAVAGRQEKLDPWEVATSEPWRPIMRTFTVDGRRDNIPDADKRVFFPWWSKDRPAPYFFRSRYGITTRAGRDPLH